MPCGAGRSRPRRRTYWPRSPARRDVRAGEGSERVSPAHQGTVPPPGSGSEDGSRSPGDTARSGHVRPGSQPRQRPPQRSIEDPGEVELVARRCPHGEPRLPNRPCGLRFATKRILIRGPSTTIGRFVLWCVRPTIPARVRVPRLFEVLTNATSRLAEHLDALGLTASVDVVFSSAELGVAKPTRQCSRWCAPRSASSRTSAPWSTTRRPTRPPPPNWA